MTSGVRARVSQSNCANAEFIKRAQQIQIVPEWLDAFHGDEKSDLLGIECARNFFVRATNDAALRLLRFGVKPRDLIKRYLQSTVRQISIFNVNGSAKDRKSTRLNSSHRCISYAVFC